MLIQTPLYCAGPIQTFLPLLGHDQWHVIQEPAESANPFRNKLQIVDKQGVKTFTIPLKASSRALPYELHEMAYQERWQQQLFNALQTAYGKAPFWEHYSPAFKAIILEHSSPYLWQFNMALLKATLKALKWPVEIVSIQTDALPSVPPAQSLPYYQVFANEIGFYPGLSILDLLFNEGINALDVLWAMKNNAQTIKYLR